MKKLISVEEAVAKVKDGMTVMIGGFLSNGTPNAIVNALAQSEVKNLILIVNDTAYPDKGCGQLIANKQVKKVIVSHIGTNPCTSEQMNSGELEIEFSPQGTLAERIRFRAVAAVPVGGFHDKVIRVARVGRVLDERLMGVADVARENDDLRRAARLRNAQRDGRAAQQVPHIGKAHLDFAGWPVEQRLPRLIGAGHKLLHDVLRVLDGVVRLDHLGTAAHGDRKSTRLNSSH